MHERSMKMENDMKKSVDVNVVSKVIHLNNVFKTSISKKYEVYTKNMNELEDELIDDMCAEVKTF